MIVIQVSFKIHLFTIRHETTSPVTLVFNKTLELFQIVFIAQIQPQEELKKTTTDFDIWNTRENVYIF